MPKKAIDTKWKQNTKTANPQRIEKKTKNQTKRTQPSKNYMIPQFN